VLAEAALAFKPAENPAEECEMVPGAEGFNASFDFSLPTAAKPRARWARFQRGLKAFLIGSPEDALVAAATTDRTLTHAAAVALLTLPLLFVFVGDGAIQRWAMLFSVLSGLLIAVRLEIVDHPRVQPVAELAGSVLYACVLSAFAWSVLGPSALQVEPAHALAALAIGQALLATRGDPRLCLLAGGVGVLSIGALETFGHAQRGFVAALPSLMTAAALAVASTLAALRGQKIQRLAILDSASGALHGAAFARCLAHAESRARAASQSITLARVEFGALREIREAHGAAFADALLRWLVRELGERFRATDLLGRTGADELAVALLDADHPGVEQRFQRLRNELSTIELRKAGLREPIALRLSFGLAVVPREALESAGADKLAQQRLALAKWRTRHAA